MRYFFLNLDFGVAFFFGFRVGLVDCEAGVEESFILDFSICFVGVGGFGVFEAGEWGSLDKSMAEYGLLSIFVRSWPSLELVESERKGLEVR